MGEDNLKIELISKDGVINALTPILSEFSINPYIQGRIIGCILNCPTVYDVEKVVAELEEKSRQETVDDMDAFGDIPSIVVSLNKAIDIVKRGGIE